MTKKGSIQCPECGTVLDLPKEEEKTSEDWVDVYLDMFKDKEGALTRENINELKNKYGNIFFIPFNNTNGYIYRQVNAGEYEEIFKGMLKVSDESDQRAQEKILNELLVYKCVVFPKITPGNKKDLPAGIVPSLAHLIHVVSNFNDPYTLSTSVYSL